MRLFAIADLHLSEVDEKPMGIFGPEWEDHADKVAGNWRRVVGGDDVVLVAGDISWAMKLEDARADLDLLAGLPGRAILLRGNHDYWWSGISKVRASLPEGMRAIQNDCVVLDDLVVAGSRGWLVANDGSSEDDWRLYRRELERLALSLACARKEAPTDARLVVGLHYPPMTATGEPTGFTELLESYAADICVFGHLHGETAADAAEGLIRGVEYRLVSCDAVNFTPVELFA